MTNRQPLDQCFRYSGAPGTDPVVHAMLIEVQMWRMLQEVRQAATDLESASALEQWIREQRAALACEGEPEERDYRLQILELAAARVRGRLRPRKSAGSR